MDVDLNFLESEPSVAAPGLDEGSKTNPAPADSLASKLSEDTTSGDGSKSSTEEGKESTSRKRTRSAKSKASESTEGAGEDDDEQEEEGSDSDDPKPAAKRGRRSTTGKARVEDPGNVPQLFLGLTFAVGSILHPRTEIMRLIVEGGGVVKNSFSGTLDYFIISHGAMKGTQKKEVLRHTGVRVVSDDWVVDSSKEGKLLDWKKYEYMNADQTPLHPVEGEKKSPTKRRKSVEESGDQESEGVGLLESQDMQDAARVLADSASTGANPVEKKKSQQKQERHSLIVEGKRQRKRPSFFDPHAADQSHHRRSRGAAGGSDEEGEREEGAVTTAATTTTTVVEGGEKVPEQAVEVTTTTVEAKKPSAPKPTKAQKAKEINPEIDLGESESDAGEHDSESEFEDTEDEEEVHQEPVRRSRASQGGSSRARAPPSTKKEKGPQQLPIQMPQQAMMPQQPQEQDLFAMTMAGMPLFASGVWPAMPPNMPPVMQTVITPQQQHQQAMMAASVAAAAVAPQQPQMQPQMQTPQPKPARAEKPKQPKPAEPTPPVEKRKRGRPLGSKSKTKRYGKDPVPITLRLGMREETISVMPRCDPIAIEKSIRDFFEIPPGLPFVLRKETGVIVPINYTLIPPGAYMIDVIQ